MEMSRDTAITSSALPFAIQLHESTDVVNLSQLLAYICYVSGPSIKEDFLLCQTFFGNSFYFLYCFVGEGTIDAFHNLSINFGDGEVHTESEVTLLSTCAALRKN